MEASFGFSAALGQNQLTSVFLECLSWVTVNFLMASYVG